MRGSIGSANRIDSSHEAFIFFVSVPVNIDLSCVLTHTYVDFQPIVRCMVKRVCISFSWWVLVTLYNICLFARHWELTSADSCPILTWYSLHHIDIPRVHHLRATVRYFSRVWIAIDTDNSILMTSTVTWITATSAWATILHSFTKHPDGQLRVFIQFSDGL